MSVGFVLILVGVVLMGISAFIEPTPRLSLWRLGWALVVAGALLFAGISTTN